MLFSLNAAAQRTALLCKNPRREVPLHRSWIGRAGLVALAIALVDLAGAQRLGGEGTLSVPALDGIPTREGFVSVANDVQLFYRLAGTAADPIVFLHGGPGLGIDDGGYDIEGLAGKGQALLMINERGAGRSTVIADAAQLGLDAYVNDLEAVRRHFSLPRMKLIGLSFGSAIVAAYAAKYPDRVNRIVFLSPMSLTQQFSRKRAEHLLSMLSPQAVARLNEIGADSFWDRTSDADLPALCRESLMPVLLLYVTDPAHLARTRGDVCGYSPASLRNMNKAGSALAASLGAWDFTPLLRSIRSPALVIEGAASQAPLDDARAWASALPDGRLLLIPDAGHMNWLDQPSAVIAALDQFFGSRWPALARPIPRDQD